MSERLRDRLDRGRAFDQVLAFAGVGLAKARLAMKKAEKSADPARGTQGRAEAMGRALKGIVEGRKGQDAESALAMGRERLIDLGWSPEEVELAEIHEPLGEAIAREALRGIGWEALVGVAALDQNEIGEDIGGLRRIGEALRLGAAAVDPIVRMLGFGINEERAEELKALMEAARIAAGIDKKAGKPSGKRRL